MFNKILIPLDGSELSEMALPYAEELASSLGSKVILYHVPEHSHQEHVHRVYLDSLAETVRQNLTKSQKAGTKIEVTTKVESGVPAENICKLIDTNHIDLIIMTAVSTSGLKIGKMLGGVTSHICQIVPIPVMLIRPRGIKQHVKREKLINRLLIPTDGSGTSKLALPVATELATKLKIPATLFRMATMLRIYDDGMMGGAFVDYTKYNADEKNRVSAEMITLEKELKAKGLDVNNIVVSGFDAAYEIMEAGKKIGIDLVVMSTHGQSGLGRWILGSVAEKILKHGETPLLLVHARAGG